MRTEEAKNGLKQLVKELNLKDSIMVEIGSFKGDSTIIFLDSGKFREVYSVDPYQNGIGDITDIVDMSEVKKHFRKATKKYDNLYQIEDFSENAANQFDNESIDFVYIDALHTYDAIKKDIAIWLPKVKKGGFIGGHDYRLRFKGVIRAVNESFGKPDKIYPDSSWIKEVR